MINGFEAENPQKSGQGRCSSQRNAFTPLFGIWGERSTNARRSPNGVAGSWRSYKPCGGLHKRYIDATAKDEIMQSYSETPYYGIRHIIRELYLRGDRVNPKHIRRLRQRIALSYLNSAEASKVL